MSKQIKVTCLVASCVAFVLTLIVIVDKLNFVARWLGHLEAYKDNIERMIYICLLLRVLPSVVKKLRVGRFGKDVKGLKANAGIFGFEVEFNDYDNATRNRCDESETKTKGDVVKQSRQGLDYCRVSAMERKIISILSTELQLTFAANTILNRGGCRFRPDGFAVRNGRAYIVEIKASDRFDMIKNAVAHLKMFSNMVQDAKISHVTVIFCVVSNKPAEYFASIPRKIDMGVETEFMLRVFSPKLLEEMK